MVKNTKIKLLLVLLLAFIICIFGSAHTIQSGFLPSSEAGWALISENYHMGSEDTTYTYIDPATVKDYKDYVDAGILMWGENINMSLVAVNVDSMGFVSTYVDESVPTIAKCTTDFSFFEPHHRESWEIKINKPVFDQEKYDDTDKAKIIAHEIGHVYGLDDLENEGNNSQIMYHEYNFHWLITSKDIWGIAICTETHVDHTYDTYIYEDSNYCVKACSDCLGYIDKFPHEYTNDCDADCNNCGYIRKDVPHSYTSSWVNVGTEDTCSKLVGTCSLCGYSYVATYDHTHAWTDESDVDCNDCGYTRTGVINGSYRAVIAIDRSGSMSGEKIRLAKLGGNIFVDLIYTGDELGVVSFASSPSVDFPLQKIVEDGSGQTRLTNNTALDWDPCFSPDGSKIAFESDRDGNWEIYIMNVDDSGQKNLTNNSAHDRYSSFSPDASKIVFSSYRDGDWEIYIMNADGSEQVNLTNNPAQDKTPSFSPDGSKIVFASDRDGNYNIYIMNVDGLGVTRLTDNRQDLWPCFSPDGSKIAFASRLHGDIGFSMNPPGISIMNVDGSGQRILTYNPYLLAEVSHPCFSPDGKKIAYGSYRKYSYENNYEIYIMNVDGSGQANLTNNPAYDLLPCFSPYGSKIAFTSNRDGNYEIYIMNLDCSTKEFAQMAINALSADGTTNIGGGLRTSLNQIVGAGEPTGNEFIVLLSNGMHNTGENPSSVIPDLQARGVRVFTIGLGADAHIEMLQNIAQETGGKFFFASSAEDLPDIFTSISAELRGGGGVIKSIRDVITSLGQIVRNVFIDIFNKVVTFTLKWEGSDLDLTLIRPDGTIVNPEVAQTDPNIEYVERDTYEYYRINEPMAGEWQLIINAVDVSGQESFTLQVLGEAEGVIFNVHTDKASYTYPESILIQADVIAIDYVANAEVTGTVERPDGSTASITLFDDGLSSHGDEFADDGVYSNFFSEYTEDGVYTFNMVVDNKVGVQAFIFEIPPDEGWTPEPISPFTRESSVSVSVYGVPLTPPEKSQTELTFDFPNVQYSDMLSGKATLTSDGIPLEDMEVEFSSMLPTETLKTNAAGEIYNTPYKVEEASGISTDPVCVNFYGDPDYLPSYGEQYITVEKENATLTYNGDTLVEVGNSTTLSCQVVQEDDGYPGDITLAGSVTFNVTTEEGFQGIYNGTVGSDGVATISAELPVGIYKIVANLDSDYYTAPPSEETILAVYDPEENIPEDSFITGGGWFVPEGSIDKVNFGFEVKYKKDGNLKGNLEIIDHNTGTNYKADDFTSLTIVGNKAYFLGHLMVNGENSYPFVAIMEDNDSLGKNKDKFNIDILIDGEHIVFNEVINNGSIVIHK